MKRWKLLMFMYVLLIVAVVPCGSSECFAQTGAAVERSGSAALERLRERAEKVQQRRKARVTHSQREAAAARAKATKAKAAPETPGRGDAR